MMQNNNLQNTPYMTTKYKNYNTEWKQLEPKIRPHFVWRYILSPSWNYEESILNADASAESSTYGEQQKKTAY